MFRKAGNPIVEELTKSCRERRVNLSGLRVKKVTVELPGGATKLERYCVWCHEGKLSHGNQKYCSEACVDSALAWANPQKEQGLNILLIRQEWKCAGCAFDWRPIAEAVWLDMHKSYQFYTNTEIPPFQENQQSWVLVKRLKSRTPEANRPEVDHIVPISKGGQSLGHDNHQAICYTCHKAKTKVDNAGPRKRPELPLAKDLVKIRK